MSCRVVVGGQFGSEGKGKVTATRALELEAPLVVRCGGPNSGHGVQVDGRGFVLRQVPAGVVNPSALLMLSAGCVIDESVLREEVRALAIDRGRIVVDPRAVLCGGDDSTDESGLVGAIGSTGTGTGRALARRMARAAGVRLAADSERLRSLVRVEPVAPIVHTALARGGDVIVEGTQGFALSLLHGEHYPFLTSRDTTAAGFASEVGLSPRSVDAIEMVIRTFPIRVGGNSGPLADEISWDVVRDLGGAPTTEPEFTSVTHRLRRVARFDLEAVMRATRYNQPTAIAVMGVDRLDHTNRNRTGDTPLTEVAEHFVEQLERATNVPVELVGTGFGMRELVYRGGSDRVGRHARRGNAVAAH